MFKKIRNFFVKKNEPQKTKPKKVYTPPKILKTHIELVLIELITGEEIIAKMIFSGKEPLTLLKKYHRIIDPYIIEIVSIKNGCYEVFLDKWITLSSSTLYDIKEDHIINMSIPNEMIINLYHESLNLQNNTELPDNAKSVNNLINNIILSQYR